jgi:hypothetical protein
MCAAPIFFLILVCANGGRGATWGLFRMPRGAFTKPLFRLER